VCNQRADFAFNREKPGKDRAALYTVLGDLMLTCRRYVPDDFARLYAIEEECFAPLFRFGRRYMRQLLKSANAATWIAETEGGMAGFGIVEWTLDEGQMSAYIQTLEVAPQARRQGGVGSKLLGQAEASARQAGAGVLWLHVDAQNLEAIRMYEAYGYGYEGGEENYYPQGRAALIYAKRLEGASTESAPNCR
jgi:ribosomal protein S18 acetylase RimI-like enzyme